MSYQNSPRIVTDGLVLCLDAGNTKSYSGSGTNWTDMSGYSNNGTLTNGPTFSGTRGGGIVFDGTNDKVEITSTTSLNPSAGITCEAFAVVNSWGNNYAPLIFKQNNYSGYYEQYNLLVGSGPTAGIVVTGTNRSQKVASTSTISLGSPVHLTATADMVTGNLKIYLNGELKGTTTGLTDFDISSVPVRLGGTGTDYPGYLNGTIYAARIYNRALTPSEILQNYNSTKSRFGL